MRLQKSKTAKRMMMKKRKKKKGRNELNALLENSIYLWQLWMTLLFSFRKLPHIILDGISHSRLARKWSATNNAGHKYKNAHRAPTTKTYNVTSCVLSKLLNIFPSLYKSIQNHRYTHNRLEKTEAYKIHFFLFGGFVYISNVFRCLCHVPMKQAHVKPKLIKQY